MEGNKEAQPSPAPASAAAAVNAVLGSEDLLREIILRLEFPTCLVRAAAVCRRWLRHASDPTFLRRFRESHRPRLLGFYLQGTAPRQLLFVPVSEAPELATAIRRAGVPGDHFIVRGCRDGRLLVRYLDAAAGQHAVLSPLHPARAAALVPPPPRPTFTRFFLYKVGGAEDGVMALEFEARRGQAEVFTLQSGVWVFRTSASVQLPNQLSAIGDILPPVHGKMYIQTIFGYILELDLAAASFSVLHLPDQVNTTNFRLSCGEDSGLFVIHAEGFLLSVWNRRTGNNGAHDWVLVADEICVREASNRMEDILVVGADDNAEFVLLGLERSGLLVSMHLRSRIEKVHHERFGNLGLVFVFPFVMTWPPIFPARREENNQEE